MKWMASTKLNLLQWKRNHSQAQSRLSQPSLLRGTGQKLHKLLGVRGRGPQTRYSFFYAASKLTQGLQKTGLCLQTLPLPCTAKSFCHGVLSSLVGSSLHNIPRCWMKPPEGSISFTKTQRIPTKSQAVSSMSYVKWDYLLHCVPSQSRSDVYSPQAGTLQKKT